MTAVDVDTLDLGVDLAAVPFEAVIASKHVAGAVDLGLTRHRARRPAPAWRFWVAAALALLTLTGAAYSVGLMAGGAAL